MKTLAIMRHAVAERGGRDYDRPLAARGREQAAVQAGRLKEAIGVVDIAVTSGAARTRQTLTALRSGGLNVVREVEIDALYSASWREVVDEMCALDPSASTVLIIGHEPTVSVMTAMLSTADTAAAGHLAFGFSTAQFVWGEVENWASLSARTFAIKGVQRPEI